MKSKSLIKFTTGRRFCSTGVLLAVWVLTGIEINGLAQEKVGELVAPVVKAGFVELANEQVRFAFTTDAAGFVSVHPSLPRDGQWVAVDIDPAAELRSYYETYLPVPLEGTWMARLSGDTA